VDVAARLGSLLRSFGSSSLDLFYPPHCAACGCRIVEGDRGNLSDVEMLCCECREKVSLPPEHRCPVCSHPLMGMAMCSNCEGRRWHLSAIVAACRYEGLVRELIQRFKYGRDQSLVRPLGSLLAGALDDPRLKGKAFDAIVPVPLHPLREREREFNQSELLARFLGKRTGIPVVDLLRRTRRTAPQAGFDRDARMRNLEGAFGLAKGKQLSPDALLLLVDDVSTTGSTLDACASVLMEEGASEVCGVVVARG
jgi:ComF family protein